MDCFPCKQYKVSLSEEEAQVRKTLLGREIRDRIQRLAIMFCVGKLQRHAGLEKLRLRFLVILILTSYVFVGKSHHFPLRGFLGDSKTPFSSKNVNTRPQTAGQLVVANCF